MMSYNKSYNRMVSSAVILLESLIAGGTFYGLYEAVAQTNISKTITAPIYQVVLTLILTYMICASLSGVLLYRRKVYAFQIMGKVGQSVTTFSILSMLILFVGNYMDPLSHLFLIYILLLGALITLFRLTLRHFIKLYRSKGGNLRYIVISSSGENAEELYAELSEEKWTGYRIMGYFDDVENVEFSKKCKYLGGFNDIIPWLEKNEKIHYLYSCQEVKDSEFMMSLIRYCENHLVRFYSIPNLHSYYHNKMFFGMEGNIPYMTLHRDPLNDTANKLLKRMFDVAVSGVFLVTLFPIILIVVSVITKITMPGPVFFKQKRNGLNDKEFYCYKFRSMKVNADADRLQATKDDPRKTKWGNIMRKTNIDELPQFINVFVGDMSVVGPRPHMLKHTEEYSKLIDKYMVRHLVKPGITGWSQVTGFRGETKELSEMEGRIRGDIWYIENWTLWLDVYIMCKTVKNVIVGEKKAY